MLFTNIKIAFRQLKRSFFFSLINILGLALGMAGSFVMGSWIWQELSYDKHFRDSENIYRVSVSFYNSGAFALGPEQFNQVLQDRLPEVELSTKLQNERPQTVEVNDNTFEQSLFYADSNYFDLFSYEFIQGNEKRALKNSGEAVITSGLALKWFGSKQVLGHEIVVGDDQKRYAIIGVVDTENRPSHINAEIWLPYEPVNETSWTSARVYNYIKLKPGTSPEKLQTALTQIQRDEVFPSFKTPIDYEAWKELNRFSFHVRPLEDIHLEPDMRFELQAGGNKTNVHTFIFVAIILMVIAAINFVNLSSAQAIKRFKEVGVRKTLGSSQRNLLLQFMSETMVLALIAMVVGIGLSEIFIILFEQFTNEKLIGGLFEGYFSIILYVGYCVLVGLMAGIFPAIYLSKNGAIESLKSKGEGTTSNRKLRNSLVIIQFTISIVLIICSLFVYSQIDFLRHTDIGLDREQVLIIDNAELLGKQKASFKNELVKNTNIKSAAYSKRIPAGRSLWIYSFKSEKMDEERAFQTFFGDSDYIETIGLRLKAGRNFSPDLASDSMAVIINEVAAKFMMLENPVGTILNNDYHIIGVVQDFSFQSFRERPEPAILMYNPDGYRLAVKIREGAIEQTIVDIQKQWNNLNLSEPMNYKFLDQSFESLMEKEKTLANTVTFFTSLAVFVSCLGLFGLAAYTTCQKQKEIGIRKVLGAGVLDIVLLLNKNFTQLVLVALIIAIPLGYWLTDQWLQQFAYKIGWNVWIYGVSGVFTLILTWLTVGYLSLKAAQINPVNSLKNE